MRILSPEKKYLYYLMISQLHEDGYTQQAVQLEVSTLYSSGSVKASDKLSRLFSSCLLSVNEATNYFSAKGPNYNIAGKKRHSNQSAINIRAANLANLAKRRRTAASLDSTNMLQDSIKKCVKLVTTDLQKATADITKIPQASSPLIQPSNMPGPSRHLSSSPKSHRSPASAAGQIVSPGRSKMSSKNLANVSNSFLKGINLFKSSSMPAVTPYSKVSAPNKGICDNKTAAAQILAKQRMTSDSASVVRVTKNITNDPVVIDVEAPSVSLSMSGLQLTRPQSSPVTSTQQAPPAAHVPRQQHPKSFMLTNPKPVLTVGQNKASALKSLVNRITKKPVLSIPMKHMAPQMIPAEDTSRKPSNVQVVILDEPSNSPVKTSSVPSPNITASQTRKQYSPSKTVQSPRQPSLSPSRPSSIPPPITSNPVLSALGLQRSQNPRPNDPTSNTQYPDRADPTRGRLTSSESPPINTLLSPTPPPTVAHLNNMRSPPPLTHSVNNMRSPPPAPTQARQINTPPPAPALNSMRSPPPLHTPSSPASNMSSPSHIATQHVNNNNNNNNNNNSDSNNSIPSPAPITTEDIDIKPLAPLDPLAPLNPLPPVDPCSCDDPELKYPIHTQDTVKPDTEAAPSASDIDFPAEIFAEETVTKSEQTRSPPTSLSDALHAASDALLEQ